MPVLFEQLQDIVSLQEIDFITKQENAMWEIGIGPLEIVLLLAVMIALSFSAPTRRWMLPVLSCLLIGMLVTAPDPVSMLLVGLSLFGALAIGVSLSPYLRSQQST